MINLLVRALMMSTPLLFSAIAEVMAERSGMMVTAIEGIFLLGAYLAKSLAFGLAEAIAIYMQSSGGGFFPNELFIALPYILTIVLTITRKSFNVPAKLGIPYKKEN